MIFTLDKHNQLSITTTGDITMAPGEPDTIVLTQDETDELRKVLAIETVRDDDGPERPSQWARNFFRLKRS